MDDKELLEWAKGAAADRRDAMINSRLGSRECYYEEILKATEADNEKALAALQDALVERFLLRERVRQLEIELEQLRLPVTK